MGCCLTKNNPQNPNIEQPTNPPPLFEEETVVKEVLSETPSLKKKTNNNNNNNNGHANPLESQTPISPNPPICIPKPEPETNTSVSVSVSVSAPTEEVSVDSISELSEISTQPITETKQQIQRKRHNSNAEKSPASLRRKRPSPTGGSKSPARKPPQSPGRKTDIGQMGQTPRRSSAPRRDSGEGASRRSRSPATRAAPGKAPVKRVGRVPAGASEDGRRSADRRRPANESLENPQVSLECFIFL